MTAKPNELHVFHDGMDWYVATNEEDSLVLRDEFLERGESDGGLGPEYKPMAQLPDDELVGVLCNSLGEPDDHGKGVKRTAAEWAKRQGRGVLCSRDF